jgi:hypothetical protein
VSISELNTSPGRPSGKSATTVNACPVEKLLVKGWVAKQSIKHVNTKERPTIGWNSSRKVASFASALHKQVLSVRRDAKRPKDPTN